MRLLLAIFILSFLISCKSAQKDDEWQHFAIKVNCRKIEGQSFIQAANVERDVPKKFTNPNDYGLGCIEESLGLTTLWNGFDSLEVRLWGNDSSALSYVDRIIVLRSRKGKHTAEIIHVKYKLRPDSGRAVLDSLIGSRRSLNEPRAGWKEFHQKLASLGIEELPDSEKSTGYSVDTDSGGYSIEFATKAKYRRFGYPAPKGKETDDAKKFVRIIEFIESEFEVNKVSMPLTERL